MSLFKERSVNAKKVISLENTILALKKQLQESKSSDHLVQISKLKEELSALRAENLSLREECELLKQKPAPKKRGPKKKAAKQNES